MTTRGVPWRRLGVWTLVVLCGAGVALRWWTRYATTTIEWQLRERAVWCAAWRAALPSAAGLQERLVALDDTLDPLDSTMRLTVLSPQGVVVADAADPAALGRSQHDAPDVLAAFARGVGSTRTPDGAWVVTKAVMADGDLLGAVRVRLPADAARRVFWDVQRRVGWTALGCWIVGCLLLGWRRTRGVLVEPVNESVTPSPMAETILTVLERWPDGVVLVDRHERLQYCNRAALQLTSDQPLAWQGHHVWEVFRWPDVHMALTAARGTSDVVEYEIRTPASAGDRLILVHAMAVGEYVGLIVRDVTTLRHLERVRRDFVANVSHELQTPLMALVGYLELLREEPAVAGGAAAEWAEKIAGQAERLQTLLASLLRLARAEAETMPALVPCDLAVVVREALQRWTPLTPIGVAVACEIAPGDHWVHADPAALVQILDNLLSNALRHTDTGTVTIELERTNAGQTLAVRDTGIGIPLRMQERVFERFYQVDPVRGQDRSGTGLGLAIVKHLVQAQQATITVQSTEGVGTVFFVRWFIKS